MFQFKQFIVHQDQCGMKISSAACMLGSLAVIELETHTILDIGAGTGLLSLMLAQRCEANIEAIEINKDAAQQARENFSGSPWRNRLALIEEDVSEWFLKTDKQYDMIVCNPPFFRMATVSTEQKRRLARHEHSLDVRLIATIATKLLYAHGTIWLLIAAESYLHYLSIFEEKHFFLYHEIALWDSPEAEKPFCYILAFGQTSKTKLSEKIYFRTAKNGVYSEEYIAAMKEYLIIF